MLKRGKGFTLIELLVVVAIIGALIAILVPSLAKVRRRAKTLMCATNVRGLVQAYNLYTQQSGNLLTGAGHGPGGAWDWQLLGSPLGTITMTQYYSANGKALAQDKLRFCPETDVSRRGGRTLGNEFLGWDCNAGGVGSSGSYQINNWTFANNSDKNYNLKRLISDSVVPVFADGRWHDVAPEPNDAPLPNLTSPDTAAEAGPGFGTRRTLSDIALNRHDKKVNVSFWDGRAETMKLEELWNLRWHKKWVAPPPVNINY